MTEPISRIIAAIDKYKQKAYDEAAFHQTIESILFSLSDGESFELKELVRKIESQLELIDFTVENNAMRGEYLLQIKKIEDFLKCYL